VLFGVLIQKFLNYQLKERDSTPFLKVLKNLRLTQKDVENAFVALQNKMQEYNVSHWWRDLKKSIALNFVEAGENWNFSPDEIGFYIAIGMSLYSLPIFGREENNSEGGEDVSEE
jgi:CRISPR-associated protein Cas8b/Csh1 subtype I-B